MSTCKLLEHQKYAQNTASFSMHCIHDQPKNQQLKYTNIIWLQSQEKCLCAVIKESLKQFTQFIWQMYTPQSQLNTAGTLPVPCYCLHPPLPLIIIHQLQSWYSVYVSQRVEGWVDIEQPQGANSKRCISQQTLPMHGSMLSLELCSQTSGSKDLLYNVM